MDRGAWWAAVHGIAKSRTWLNDFTFTFHFHALAKEMATHSSVLAWRIPGTEEPGGLLSMGSHRVGHNWLSSSSSSSSMTKREKEEIDEAWRAQFGWWNIEVYCSLYFYTCLKIFIIIKTNTMETPYDLNINYKLKNLIKYLSPRRNTLHLYY